MYADLYYKESRRKHREKCHFSLEYNQYVRYSSEFYVTRAHSDEHCAGRVHLQWNAIKQACDGTGTDATMNCQDLLGYHR